MISMVQREDIKIDYITHIDCLPYVCKFLKLYQHTFCI